jgi:ABC-2 type transport system ATP-binding protein
MGRKGNMAEAIVQVRGLSKTYEAIQAVDDIEFEIARGEIFSLLGPNGAGKTTTISMLSCLVGPTRGDAAIGGISVISQPGEVKQLIGVVPQEIALYPTLSARENLAFWGKMYGLGGMPLKERIAKVLEIAGLSDRADEKIETYSGGMKRRINIAVGLLHEPKVLFMDEPTVGIDPQSRRRILDTVLELNRNGLTVLYTTHYMEEAQELSDRIGIIDHGKLIALGTLSELTRTVGQFDTLQISVELSDQANGALANAIQKMKDVHRATVEEGQIFVQVSDATAVLGEVVSQIDKAGGRILSINIEEPNLEAVFLHLTGRALRD